MLALRVLTAILGRVRGGVIRLTGAGQWPDGQRVLVVPLPEELPGIAPPQDLLEEDACELAPGRASRSGIEHEEP
jgi:hypothetical protein